MSAALYDPEGKVFARYQHAPTAAQPPAVEDDGYRFAGNSLRIFRGIDLAGERIGTIYLEADPAALDARLGRYGAIVVLVMIVASFLAFLLSRRLQASISGPISMLAGVAGVVGPHHRPLSLHARRAASPDSRSSPTGATYRTPSSSRRSWDPILWCGRSCRRASSAPRMRR